MPRTIFIRQDEGGNFRIFNGFTMGYQTVSSVRKLVDFLSVHDYRYVPGTFGRWVLP